MGVNVNDAATGHEPWRCGHLDEKSAKSATASLEREEERGDIGARDAAVLVVVCVTVAAHERSVTLGQSQNRHTW